ncbi:DUF2892 domain-containing protein [Thalassobaculum sp. OXR-137]|uniref:YgaP family membrane protein n=1 Tax=Thalassobaculum sp. OXR-137 TaxID=3100173 RepID=UPI002AC974D1|nr:DUF2892 domain-containing protein [Thalassobaculum sp. OXR-137]WPZ33469.1 DUF2892 domain-containing protein [Thalassobaculum sp. OXR-137]
MSVSRPFAPNMHTLDRIVRLVLGVGCLYAGFIDWGLIPNAVISVLVGLFGVVNLGSAIFGYCPVYRLGGIRTNRASE